jgi:hypothetical protein
MTAQQCTCGSEEFIEVTRVLTNGTRSPFEHGVEKGYVPTIQCLICNRIFELRDSVWKSRVRDIRRKEEGV